jgi:hypothetical protein
MKHFSLVISFDISIASTEQVSLNQAHEPRENAIEAFNVVLHQIKSEIIKSRHDWDKHEPKMWSRASGLSDHELTNFMVERDLVLVRSRMHDMSSYFDPDLTISSSMLCDVSDSGWGHGRHPPLQRRCYDF